MQSTTLLPAQQKKRIKAKASDILNREGGHNRLTMVLALLVVAGVGLAIPVVLDCLWLTARLLSGSARTVLSVMYDVLLHATYGLVTLPLCMGVYRMAVRMVHTDAVRRPDTLMPNEIHLYECFYAFTSPKAYVRSLVAGLQVAIRWGGTVLLPVGFVALTDLWKPALVEMTGAPIMLTVAQILLAVAIGVAWLVILLPFEGYTYLLFANPDLTVGEVNRLYRRRPKSRRRAFGRMVGGIVRIIVGAIPVLIPLLIHTLPSLMLASVLYEEELAAEGDSDPKAE